MSDGLVDPSMSAEWLRLINELSDRDLRADNASDAIHFAVLVISLAELDLMLPRYVFVKCSK